VGGLLVATGFPVWDCFETKERATGAYPLRVTVPDPTLHEFPDKEKELVVAGELQYEEPAS
jgi:hypothetical protein